MSLYVFNNSQKLIKLISDKDLINVMQEKELNKEDILIAEIPTNVWRELKEKAFYMAVRDPYERFVFHMYKVAQEELGTDSVQLKGVQIGYDELKSKGFIKDKRFVNGRVLDAMNAIVEGTDWRVGYVDDTLPKVNTNFYYTSRLEALSKLVRNIGGEIRFSVTVSGNKITSKQIDVYKRISKFKGKRFALGSNLLEVVKEEDTSELYTALVGRGKGIEVEDEQGDATGGYGRKLSFADVVWKKTAGNPVDKPAGQEFVELPDRTALYGYPDGSPRIGFVEFLDIEDADELIRATYETLLEASRPKRQFKAIVEATGDMELGETVAIIAPDFRYKTRVFRVKRDYLNNYATEVEFGDKLTQTMNERINKVVGSAKEDVDEVVNIIQSAANGKNKIFRGPDEPLTGMRKGDLWYKPIADGEYELYIFDGDSWGEPVVTTGVNKEIDDAIKAAEQIAEDARDKATGASNRVQQAIDDAADAYEYADSAITAANSKNTVYRGIEEPATGNPGDLWYQEINRWENGETVQLTRLHVYTNDIHRWQLRADDAENLGGTLDLSTLNTINLNFDSGTGGSLHLDRGIKITNNSQDVLKVEYGNVEMNVDNLLIQSKGLDDVIGTEIYQNNESVGLVYRDDQGVEQSLIDVGADGPYISGKNIVLDGNTVVDGTFTVTNSMLAKDATIKNLKGQTLNFAEITTINFDANSITTGYLDGIAAYLEEGIVGGWTIDSTKISSGTTNIASTSNGDYAMWVGGETAALSPLNMRHTGRLDAHMLFSNSIKRTSWSKVATIGAKGDRFDELHVSSIHGSEAGDFEVTEYGTIYGETLRVTNILPKVLTGQEIGSPTERWRDIHFERLTSSGSHVTVRGSNLRATVLRSNSIYRQTYDTNAYIGQSSERFNKIFLSSAPDYPSDARIKEFIQNIPESLVDKMIALEPKMYKKKDEDVWEFGYIAQDVERIIYKETLELYGRERAKEIQEDFNVVAKYESYMSLVYQQISVMKDAQHEKQIKELEKRLEALENV